MGRYLSFRLVGIAISLLAGMAALACSPTVGGIDGDGGGGRGGGPECNARPACDVEAREVASCSSSDKSCRTLSACGVTISCEFEDTHCAVEPACHPGDQAVKTCPVEAVACYTVSVCGGSIVCAHACPALACDPGDSSIGASKCTDDMPCYAVKACGATITCVDAAMPQHGCPATEPTPGDDCEDFSPKMECAYTPCDVYSCNEINGGAQIWSLLGGCGGSAGD